MKVDVSTNKAEMFLSSDIVDEKIRKAAILQKKLYQDKDSNRVFGWTHVKSAAVQLDEIKVKAAEVRRKAEVFVIAGVGGSNQAARAMIEALQGEDGPRVIYLGNTLSPHYINKMMEQLKGKSVYINVIAKNFETLEPGSHFRILRNYMEKIYTKDDMSERVILTGTYGSRMEEIAKENGYTFFSFPEAIGGRYSAFSPVGLFPIAVAGLDIDKYLKGVVSAEDYCMKHTDNNPALKYAAIRNSLYEKNYNIELLTAFEPQFTYFTKWWVQLFGESEGKNLMGIFPTAAIYSEDLHSMGQYMQDGRRNLIETFIKVKNTNSSVIVNEDKKFRDGFDYLENMDFNTINKVAERATIEAHTKGGVPCIEFEVEEISEETFGAFYYIFMLACALSGLLMGVNPFDQEGVEEYKRSMFIGLGKN
ncbi:glucose-6-phosphate isomerase [Anaerocolumna sp. MB42-C2]|uniref:glucose-6-phosphate isomerase n=1 Tax=Anaerocolumna sp. MB42-C2 TaxID=3070997 RepID=UPI0027DFA136|nr:glucose-6-phosphate isomerase [Anaerocolumna sp. MB42-C2]WMJ86629.1 glucose-6-phosphate isomerase [Anaerocolumna sp. MB42-C2]